MLIALLFTFSIEALAQTKPIVSGPMLGTVELRDVEIWVEVSRSVKSVSLQYNKKGDNRKNTIVFKGELGNDFNTVQFTVGGLDYNTTYQYIILTDGKASSARGEFTTKDLWQYRKPVPDFSFLTGSCAFFNEPQYDRKFTDLVRLDRAATPYGGDSSIFETMAKENANFMLWLGDNWYTREVDFSKWGLWYRAQHDRSMPVMQNLLKKMAHYAIWDDHDYGPNDIGKHYVLKETSREVFMNYWCNPSYGEDGEGIYTMFSYGDVDFFLLDDRWWRSHDWISDSIDNKPNPAKNMFGPKQMEWLKNELLYSRASFKVIVTGSQVLNPGSPFDKFADFSYEYNDLMNFIREKRVNGILFLTGDRHHSEVIKVEREGTYPLYDITVSPLTSGTHVFGNQEKNNPYRVFGLDQKQNYGRISVTGKKGERKFLVEFLGIKGEKLGEWSVLESSLRTR